MRLPISLLLCAVTLPTLMAQTTSDLISGFAPPKPGGFRAGVG
jgi:hypothetical protein